MADIRCPLIEAARRYKDLPALITDNHIISYDQYDRLVASAAYRLKNTSVTPGERVAVVSANRVEYPVLLMALFRIGAVACPVSPRLPQQTVAEYIKKIGCSKIFDKLNAEQQTPSAHRHSRESGNPEGSTGYWMPVFTGMTSPARFEYESRLFQHSTSDHFVSLDQDATIIATSGTSARPKAVLHTYGNHYYSAIGSNKNIKVQPGDRWLLSLPLYHVGGLAILFRTMLSGGAVVISHNKIGLFQSIQKHRITHLSLVSTQLFRLLQERPNARVTKGLKALLVGGSNIPPSLITKAYESGLPLFTTYGLTEMTSQVTATTPGDSLDKLLTSGRLLDHRQVRISSEGEVLVKGDTLFRGYAVQDEVYLPVDGEGWFHTGDIGRLDDTGCLTVRGRKDSMFISGGENIHPEEIEGTLSLLDDVSDAVVVPMEDDEFGFRPVAFIRTAGSKRVYKSDLVARLEQYLPRFKIPTRFYKWPETAHESDVKPSRPYFRELVSTGELIEVT